MSQYEEATNQLRFVRRDIVFEHDGNLVSQTKTILQQAFRIMVRDDETGVLMGGHMEWRDVPMIDEPPPSPAASSDQP